MNNATLLYKKLLQTLNDLRASEEERDAALRELQRLRDEYEALDDELSEL